MSFLDFFRRKQPQTDGSRLSPGLIKNFQGHPDLHINVSAAGEDFELGEQESKIWTGPNIRDVFRSSKNIDLAHCPKCRENIHPWYCGLIYACTCCGSRTHMGPYAHICIDCNLAVINEDIPQKMAQSCGHTYILPLAMYNLKKGPPKDGDLELFKTFEGREPVFVLTEEGCVIDLMYKGDVDNQRFISSHAADKDIKRKRKAQRKARKRNRLH